MASKEVPTRPHLRLKLLFILVYLGFLAFNMWIFLVRAHGPWQSKAGILLEVVGFYTFAFGFLSQTDILKRFGKLTDEMTSPNLYRFMRGNFIFLAMLTSLWSLALTSRKTSYSSFHLLGGLFLIVCAPAVFIYVAFHTVVIMPIAYLAYVIVSIPLRAIQTSVDDIAFSVGEETVRMQDIISTDIVSMRNFFIAIPAVVLSMFLKITSAFW